MFVKTKNGEIAITKTGLRVQELIRKTEFKSQKRYEKKHLLRLIYLKKEQKLEMKLEFKQKKTGVRSSGMVSSRYIYTENSDVPREKVWKIYYPILEGKTLKLVLFQTTHH